MRPSSSLHFLVALLLLLHDQSRPLVDASVEDTCMAAAKSDPRVNYDFCVNRLYHHHSSGDADAWMLAQIAAELSINNSDIAIGEIKTLLMKTSDAIMVSILKHCATLHDSMRMVLANAYDQIHSRHYDAAKTLLNQAISMAQECEISFSKAGKRSLLTPWNEESVNLSVLSLAITNLLK